MELISLEEAARPARRLTAFEVSEVIARALREGRVSCVSPGTRNFELTYWALAALGAKRIPVGEGCSASLEDLGLYEDLERRDDSRVYKDPLELLSGAYPTPLVRLRWTPGSGVRVWAKLEWFNPFSLSLKDRPAAHMIKGIEASRDSLVADASSSNFAVAMAALSNLMGLRARVYLPGGPTGRLGRVVASLMGAEVVVDRSARFTTELLERVLRESEREGFHHLNQFTNDLNFEAHLRGIARELDYQARRAGIRLRGVAGSLGTSGHMAAVTFYFKSMYGDQFDVVLAQPDRHSTIPGLRRIETGMLWINLLDFKYRVYDVDLKEALSKVAEVSRTDGLLIGPSGGAVLAALERRISEGGLEGDVAAIIPDTGFKYLDLLEDFLGGVGEGGD